MGKSVRGEGVIRKLWPADHEGFRDHLLRLDGESRRLRFGMATGDRFIADYAARLGTLGSVVHAYMVDGDIRAAGELRPFGGMFPRAAEAAFSVERDYQNSGIGSELLGRTIRAARNRGIKQLYMNCLAENGRMQHVARKYDADLSFEVGEVVGEVTADYPSYYSLWKEAVDDSHGYVTAIFDLHSRTLTPGDTGGEPGRTS